MELSFSLTNLLGVAETATLTGQYGSASSNELAITLAKPRPFSYPVQTELLLLQQSNNFQKFSSFTERLQGGIFSVSRQGSMLRLILAALLIKPQRHGQVTLTACPMSAALTQLCLSGCAYLPECMCNGVLIYIQA